MKNASSMRVKVTRKGQVTVPSIIRKTFGLEEGSYVVFEKTERAVLLRKASRPEPGRSVGEERFKQMILELERLRSSWRS